MSYQSEQTLRSLRQRLAVSISYAKEILAGPHGNEDTDHRPDLMGELGTAEHLLEDDLDHAEILDKVLALRRQIEANDCTPTAETIATMRKLWTEVMIDTPQPAGIAAPSDARRRFLRPKPHVVFPLPKDLEDRSPVDILILPGNSDDELQAIRTMITNNLTGVNRVHEGSIPEDAAEYILVWPPHTGVIREVSAGLDYPIYKKTRDGKPDWKCKPQVIKKEDWLEHLDMDMAMDKKGRTYESRTSPHIEFTEKVSTICCSAKGRFRSGAYFIRWSTDNFHLLPRSLTSQMRWPGLDEQNPS